MSSVPQLDRTVPVLIFKIGHYVIHHGTLGIVRSLGRLGVPVYAIVEDRFSPVAASRYLAGSFVWPTSGLDAAALLTGLRGIRSQLGRRAILIPTDDRASAFIAEHAGELAASFLLPPVPPDLPRRLGNKKDLHFLCRSAGVPSPQASFPSSPADVAAFIEKASFPVVVKALDTRLLPKGGRTTSIASTPDELLAIYRETENPDTPNLMFQEYIPQSSGEDWIFHGYSNPQTGCLVSFTGRKLRSWPPFAGPTSLGVPMANELLRVQTERLVRAIGYAGVMDLDYRFDKRDGQYKLLDFNPRIGANFRMFEDPSGIDVARALHLDLTGRRIVPAQPVRRTFIVEPFDLFAALGYMRHGELTVRKWLESIRGTWEIAWFDAKDPLPFPLVCLRLVSRTVRGALAGKWTHLKNRLGAAVERLLPSRRALPKTGTAL